jgi:hypothetical protein
MMWNAPGGKVLPIKWQTIIRRKQGKHPQTPGASARPIMGTDIPGRPRIASRAENLNFAAPDIV